MEIRVHDSGATGGTDLDERAGRLARFLAVAFAVVVGVAITLCLRGYALGKSNHTVYLLEAIHWMNPALLNHDWYVTHTLQYHLVFGAITRWLMARGLEPAGFFIGYMLSVILMHAGWLAIVFRLGGGVRAYLLSVVLFYLSAGGTGLGAFQFDQDGSFLPSNVANVAMLWGIWLWMRGNRGWAGVMLGVAGLWHINHAAVGVGLFAALSLWEAWRPVSFQGVAGVETRGESRWTWQQLLGAIVLLALSSVNIIPALLAKLEPAASKASLEEFVRLYVYLRHPHHYGPRTWPMILWFSFLWSSAAASWIGVWVLSRQKDAPARGAWIETSRVFVIFWLLLIVGLLGAGIWFVSDSLIQLAVYRFTIYLQLLSCIAVAWWLVDSGVWRYGKQVGWWLAAGLAIVVGVGVLGGFDGPSGRVSEIVRQNIGALMSLIALVIVMAVIVGTQHRWGGRMRVAGPVVGMVLVLGLLATAAWGRFLGLKLIPEDDAQYLEVAHWARDHTPVDAVFLVPPNEQAFRLEAQRAIYINFKGVPQLRNEIATWRDRLGEVLDMTDFSSLPRGFDQTLKAIGERYESLPAAYLIGLAQRRGIRYVLVNHRLIDAPGVRMVYQSSGGEYFLYDLVDLSPGMEQGRGAVPLDGMPSGHK